MSRYLVIILTLAALVFNPGCAPEQEPNLHDMVAGTWAATRFATECASGDTSIIADLHVDTIGHYHDGVVCLFTFGPHYEDPPLVRICLQDGLCQRTDTLPVAWGAEEVWIDSREYLRDFRGMDTLVLYQDWPINPDDTCFEVSYYVRYEGPVPLPWWPDSVCAQ